MHDTVRRFRRLASAASAALLLTAHGACRDDEPERGSRTEGGENALDRAGRKIGGAAQSVKRKVEPAARAVAEETKKVVEEGKKVVKKGAEAVDDAVD